MKSSIDLSRLLNLGSCPPAVTALVAVCALILSLSIPGSAAEKPTKRNKTPRAAISLGLSATFSLQGVEITATGDELNKLSGTSANVSAANLNTLTGASNADDLHSHALIAGLGISKFLRSNVTDTFNGPTFTFDGVSNLRIAGGLEIGTLVDGDDTRIYFDYLTSESFGWDDAESRFEFTDNLALYGALETGATSLTTVAYNRMVHSSADGPGSGHMTGTSDLFVSDDIEVGGTLYLSKDLYMEGSSNGLSNGDQSIHFYANGNRSAEYFRWNSDESRFDFSDHVQIFDSLKVGDFSSSNAAYSSFGLPEATSFGVTNTDDIFVRDDVEVGGSLYLSKTLYLEGANNGLSNGNQMIYFYDSGSNTAESLKWDNTDKRFELSDDVFSAGFFEGSGLSSLGHVYVTIDSNANTTNHLLVTHHGTADILADFNEAGDLYINGDFFSNAGLDLAESFLAGEEMSPGNLVRVSDLRPTEVLLASSERGRLTLGVVSTDPGMILGGAPFDPEDLAQWDPDFPAEFRARYPAIVQSLMAENPSLAPKHLVVDGEDNEAESEDTYSLDRLAIERFFAEVTVPVALSGRVPVTVDASFGAIEIGDPIGASPRPGWGMRASEPGPIVGTALEALASGEGSILVFVSRGWLGGNEVEASRPQRAEAVVETDRSPRVSPVPAASQAEQSIREMLRIDADGTLHLGGALEASGDGVAQYLPIGAAVEPGQVVVASADGLIPASMVDDPAVVGVISPDASLIGGDRTLRLEDLDPALARRLEEARYLHDEEEAVAILEELDRVFRASHAPVAIAGVVSCKVDAGFGAIRIGDLLTSSSTTGYAMRSSSREAGTILGKALENLDHGSAEIRVLIMLR